jgi:glutathione S-transferase
VKFEDDVLHPAIRPATFAQMMSPELASRSDAELDELVAKHPNKKRAEEYRKAAREPADPAKVEAATNTIVNALQRMERRLSEVPWLGGQSYSLADIAAAPFIDRLEELDLTDLWKGHPAIRNWIGRTKARPAYRIAIPENDQRFTAAVHVTRHKDRI